MTRAFAVLTALVLLSVGTPVWAPAQENPELFGPGKGNGRGPWLDSVSVSLASRSYWRGFDLGSPELRAQMGVALGGYPATAHGKWGLYTLSDVRLVQTQRSSAPEGSRLSQEVSILRDLRKWGTLAAVTSGYLLTGPQQDNGGGEAGMRLTGLDVPWLPEGRLQLSAQVLRDFGHYDGTAAQIDVEMPFGAKRLCAGLGAQAFWDDYSSGFAYRGAEADLNGTMDVWRGQTASLRLSAAGSILWNQQSPSVGRVLLGTTLIH